MDNKNNPYGQYLLLLLSQMMKNTGTQSMGINEMAGSNHIKKDEKAESEYFGKDETESVWRREDRTELLNRFCREGYGMASRYGHFILGEGPLGNYIGIPGRFLLAEQPAGGVTGFTLWQPLKGGEEYFRHLDNMAEDEAHLAYGYWIAAIDPKTLEISEV